MPTYTFQCKPCNTSLKRRMATKVSPQCPECSARMEQDVPEVRAAFRATNDGATGSQSRDYDFDRVVGEGAEKIWAKYADRQIGKHNLLAANPGKTGYDIGKTSEGYVIMSEQARDSRKRTREVVEHIKSTVKPVGSE